jgi:phosphatidylglycerol---prolipoprotein diacylglyceryl transferase
MYPKLIEFGDFFLPAYGVLVAIAFFAALQVTIKLSQKRGLDREIVTNLAIYCALAGLAGAKLFMILFDFRDYLDGSRDLFSIATLQAAGVFQGGLIGAVAVAFWYMKTKNLPFWSTADVFAPGIALGHAIGRLGCFAAGCCWGVACDRKWAVTFRNTDAEALTGVPLGIPLHPTQIYEFMAELGVFALLLWRIRKPHREGEVLGLYLVVSSVLRFWIEFYRFHAQALPMNGPWSLTQWISLGLMGLGAWLLYGRRAPATATT